MNNGHGITLIEVMISMLIFSVGILAVAAMQITSMKNTTKCRMQMLDRMAAGSQLEQFNRMPYTHPLLIDRDSGYFPENPDFGPIKIEGTKSTLEWEIDDDFPEKKMKRITIRVRYLGQDHEKRFLTIDYLKSQN